MQTETFRAHGATQNRRNDDEQTPLEENRMSEVSFATSDRHQCNDYAEIRANKHVGWSRFAGRVVRKALQETIEQRKKSNRTREVKDLKRTDHKARKTDIRSVKISKQSNRPQKAANG